MKIAEPGPGTTGVVLYCTTAKLRYAVVSVQRDSLPPPNGGLCPQGTFDRCCGIRRSEHGDHWLDAPVDANPPTDGWKRRGGRRDLHRKDRRRRGEHRRGGRGDQ